MEILWTLLLIFICLLLEGFFSGSEIGVVSADQMKLRHDAAKGSKSAKLALKMLKKPEWLLSTTLVGTNIAVVTNTTAATALMIYLFGEKGSWLAIGLVAPLIWVFGEIVPKSVFQQRADVITPRVIFFLRFASYLFFPLLIVFTAISGLLTRAFGGRQSQNPFTLREEIFTMLHMPADHGDIEPAEKAMIRRIFRFSEITVDEVMVPLIDVAAVEHNATCWETVSQARESAHIRLPVYEGRVDRIVGLVNALELLDTDQEEPIRSYVRPVRFVPMSKNISELLLDFRNEGDVVAVVVDEFGGAVGLVTVEDIVEEVVEEIEDEYDTKKPSTQWARRISKKEYVVSARMEIDNAEKELGIQLPRGKYTTLAGLILDRAGEIPARGTTILVKGISFTVERRTSQSIQEIRIRL